MFAKRSMNSVAETETVGVSLACEVRHIEDHEHKEPSKHAVCEIAK